MKTKKLKKAMTENKTHVHDGKRLMKGAATAGGAIAGLTAASFLSEQSGDNVEDHEMISMADIEKNNHTEMIHDISVGEPEMESEEQDVIEDLVKKSDDAVVEQPEPEIPIPEVEPVTEEELARIDESVMYGEEIDPDDVDMADVINVDQIGTVYTVDGESMLAADIHDQDGNDLLMVDVDGDGVFDVITTKEGEIITEVGGELDVSDAEAMMTADDADYLSASDYDASLDIDMDITNDIIEL